MAAAVEQLNRVTLTSRAFHHTLLARLPGACRVDRNRDGAPDEHGCRTVESALKVARLTFGGNPLACAVGRAVIALLASGDFQSRPRKLGAHLHQRLHTLVEHGVAPVTGRGLWAGLHVAQVADRTPSSGGLADRGVLCKEAHRMTLWTAPPLSSACSHTDPTAGAGRDHGSRRAHREGVKISPPPT